MITFTKEQLIASAHARIEFAEMMLSGELEPLKERTWSIELALARIALASLEAEPVVFRSKLKPPSAIGSESWDYTDHRQPDAFELENCVIERLYTAPPAPVAPLTDGQIDEVLDSRGNILYVIADKRERLRMFAREILRAAMLQSSDGNSPAIPDGWVACSERMPEVGGLYLCYVQDEYEFDISHFCFEYLAAHKRFDSAGINITHWQPLPAAPQQEAVSSALEHGMARYSGAMQKLADGGD